MLERGNRGFRDEDDGADKFRRQLRRRLLALGLVTVIPSAVIIAAQTGSQDTNDTDYYIQNLPTPHQQHNSIPNSKAFPTPARLEFHNGVAEYNAPPEIATRTGLLAVIATCGNPADKRDTHNLYVKLHVKQTDGIWEMQAGLKAAPACEGDGTLTEADRGRL